MMVSPVLGEIDAVGAAFDLAREGRVAAEQRFMSAVPRVSVRTRLVANQPARWHMEYEPLAGRRRRGAFR